MSGLRHPSFGLCCCIGRRVAEFHSTRSLSLTFSLLLPYHRIMTSTTKHHEHEAGRPQRRRNDPYSAVLARRVQPRLVAGVQPNDVPLSIDNAHNAELQHCVPFMSYVMLGALTTKVALSHPTADAGAAVAMFAGQLPYAGGAEVLRLVLGGLCGVATATTPRVGTKYNHRLKTRVETGCAHFELSASAEGAVSEILRGRVLVDKAGVWYAETETQREALAAYVACIAATKNAKMPVRLLVLERAASVERGAPMTSSCNDGYYS